MSSDCAKIAEDLDWVLGGMVMVSDEVEPGVMVWTCWAPEFKYGGITAATRKNDVDLMNLGRGA